MLAQPLECSVRDGLSYNLRPICLIASISSAAVEIRIDTGISLVQGVRLVRSCRVRSWPRSIASADLGSTVCGTLRAVRSSGAIGTGTAVSVAYSAAAVAVAVNTGVNSVCDAGVVRAADTFGTATVLVTGGVAHALTTSVGVNSGVL